MANNNTLNPGPGPEPSDDAEFISSASSAPVTDGPVAAKLEQVNVQVAEQDQNLSQTQAQVSDPGQVGQITTDPATALVTQILVQVTDDQDSKNDQGNDSEVKVQQQQTQSDSQTVAQAQAVAVNQTSTNTDSIPIVEAEIPPNPEDIQSPESPQIFIFVNPSSGANHGQKIMDLGPKLELQIDEGLTSMIKSITVHIYSIREGRPGDKPGFHHLKRVCDANRSKKNIKTRVITCGGDGTVMWTITEIGAHKIDSDLDNESNPSYAIGVLPFGTGNDFSRTFGWGGHTTGGMLTKQGLTKLALKWLNVNTCSHDIKSIKITTYPGGGFQFCTGRGMKGLNEGLKAQHCISQNSSNSESDNGFTMVKPICNYWSIGTESRVGLGMEKNRKKTFIGNMIQYGIQGTKKFFFQHGPRFRDMCDSAISIDQNGNEKCIFQTQDPRGSAYLSNNPSTVAMINTITMARGVKLWKPSKKISVQSSSVSPDDRSKLLSHPHTLGSGDINLMSWSTTTQFNADVLSGLAPGKLCCLCGPGNGARLYGDTQKKVRFEFKNPNSEDPKRVSKYKKEGRSYQQIDGEYFICNYPKSIEIEHMKRIEVLDGRGG